jgi:hypothetical protein
MAGTACGGESRPRLPVSRETGWPQRACCATLTCQRLRGITSKMCPKTRFPPCNCSKNCSTNVQRLREPGPTKSLKNMAGTTRLELATSAVTGQRSNQLNYVPFNDLHAPQHSLAGVGSSFLSRGLFQRRTNSMTISFSAARLQPACARAQGELRTPPNHTVTASSSEEDGRFKMLGLIVETWSSQWLTSCELRVMRQIVPTVTCRHNV